MLNKDEFVKELMSHFGYRGNDLRVRLRATVDKHCADSAATINSPIWSYTANNTANNIGVDNNKPFNYASDIDE